MARSGRGDSEGSREPRALGEVLRGIGSAGNIRNGLRLGRLVRQWQDVAGTLASTTEPVALTDRGLVVRASTSAWAAQVRFLADEIRSRANAALGGTQIGEVQVVVGPLEAGRRGGSDAPGW
ncbi:MAG TPA: DUF721 domain-containing protein [Actinomycetota bacterium]|jgi:predicted nucleic acid-binding Zn ribbon protein|nr:DUF721 domain-containing protein [Actinomycetota bacterium]